jgi:hypothetical protein
MYLTESSEEGCGSESDILPMMISYVQYFEIMYTIHPEKVMVA